MPMDNTPGSITDPQRNYIEGLVKKKDLIGNTRWTPNAEQLQFLRAGDYSRMSKLGASKAIENLLKLNDKPPEPTPDVEQRLPQGATDPDEDPGSVQDLVDHDSVRFPVSSELDLTDAHTEVVDSTPVQGLDKEPPVYYSEREANNAKLTELEREVDAGYYFIVNPNLANGKRHDPNDGERFYHVSKPEPPSRWAGYTFIESRGGDYLYRVRDVKERIAILEEIKKDPITAMNEYGIRLGVCGCCGRTLTAKDSRLRGLGPICAARILGAPTQAQIELIDKLGLRKS